MIFLKNRWLVLMLKGFRNEDNDLPFRYRVVIDDKRKASLKGGKIERRIDRRRSSFMFWLNAQEYI
jgi:hypothetical protein